MTEEEFAALPLQGKWKHLASIMDYILSMDKTYNSTAQAFDLRRRLNPHHPKKHVKEETALFKEQQKNLRVDQYQRWSHAKNLYTAHRDEMANTLENDQYSEYKRIMENVLTMEFDDLLRDVVE